MAIEIVDLPIETGDFPSFFVGLPEGSTSNSMSFAPLTTHVQHIFHIWNSHVVLSHWKKPNSSVLSPYSPGIWLRIGVPHANWGSTFSNTPAIWWSISPCIKYYHCFLLDNQIIMCKWFLFFRINPHWSTFLFFKCRCANNIQRCSHCIPILYCQSPPFLLEHVHMEVSWNSGCP